MTWLPFAIAALAAVVSGVLAYFTQSVIEERYPRSGAGERVRSESIRRAADWYSDIQVVSTSAISWSFSASAKDVAWPEWLLWLVAGLHVLLLVRIITLKSWSYGTRWRHFARQPFSYGAWVVVLVNGAALAALGLGLGAAASTPKDTTPAVSRSTSSIVHLSVQLSQDLAGQRDLRLPARILAPR